MATPLSGVSTILDWSSLNSFMALNSSLVMFGVGGYLCFSSQLVSALHSSASPRLSLVQVSSIAMMFASMGGV